MITASTEHTLSYHSTLTLLLPIPRRPHPRIRCVCCFSFAQVAKADAESVKNWDRFYKRNTDRFFKDRHYLAREFADLTQQLQSLTAAASSSVAATAAAEPVHLLEVGCGVGNAL